MWRPSRQLSFKRCQIAAHRIALAWFGIKGAIVAEGSAKRDMDIEMGDEVRFISQKGFTRLHRYSMHAEVSSSIELPESSTEN
jgi:hypothetical protein